MELFVLSLLVLAVGPIVYHLVGGRAGAIAFLDGLIFVSMLGLVFLGVLPEVVPSGGLLSAVFLLAGVAAPALMERHFHRFGRTSHNLSLFLGLAGLVLHAILDGTALLDQAAPLEQAVPPDHAAHDHGNHSPSGHAHLAQAVILHRLPVGLTVWWLLRPTFGALLPLGVLGLLAAATALGFFYGPQLTGPGIAWFQAFVSGSLLHVVFHRPALGHGRSCCDEPPASTDSCCGDEAAAETTAQAHTSCCSPPAVQATREEDHASCCSPTAVGTGATEPTATPPPDASSPVVSSPDSPSNTPTTSTTVTHEPAAAVATASAARASVEPIWEGLGGLVGLVLLAGLLYSGDHADDAHSGTTFPELFLGLAYKSAPALLLAYTVAGLMNAFLPRSSIAWMGRGGSWTQSLRGMTIGLPFPICSCGVVPLFRTLVKRGAPPAAALGFLVATPELGVDAVLLSLPLLGVEMTLVRVVAAAFVALVVGALVGRLATQRIEAGSNTGATLALGEETRDDNDRGSVAARLRAGLRLSFGEGFDNTAPWILLGLLVAAFLGPLLEDGWLRGIPGALQVPLFALIGIPTYVCASGATPLVAILLLGGVSPGAALAFLLTGPATNITTFGLLGSVYDRVVAARFSATMILLPVALGYLTDFVLGGSVGATATSLHDHGATILERGALMILTAAALYSFVRNGPRRFLAEVTRT